MSTVLVVLGNQVDTDSRMTADHVAYCQQAVEYVATHSDVPCSIVCTGGHTTPGASLSEAAAAAQYIERALDKLQRYGLDRAQVYLEEESRTTPENVRSTLQMLYHACVSFDTFVVIGRRVQLCRVRALLWRKRQMLRSVTGHVPNIVSIVGPNHDSWFRQALEIPLVLSDFVWPAGDTWFYRKMKQHERNEDVSS